MAGVKQLDSVPATGGRAKKDAVVLTSTVKWWVTKCEEPPGGFLWVSDVHHSFFSPSQTK